MNQKAVQFLMTVSALVPHDLTKMASGELVADVIQGVVAGELPADITITTAQDLNVAELTPYIREVWKARLRASPMWLAMAEEGLSHVVVDDTDLLEQDFLAWGAGESLADVKAWFEEAKGK